MIFTQRSVDVQTRNDAQALYDILDGASILALMATQLENLCSSAKGGKVSLTISELKAIVDSQRLAVSVIDRLTQAVERGESLSKAMRKKKIPKQIEK